MTEKGRRCQWCRQAVLMLWLGSVMGVFSAVRISEFMAKNESGLLAAGGGYPDWIEIHNDSGAALDLAGWYLTDDPANLRKWQFPSTATTSSLADDGYLVVIADGAGDAVIGDEIHAGFRLGAGGEYLALIEPDGETIAHQYSPEFPAQSADVSYGIDSGSGGFAYFVNPTPGAANGMTISGEVELSVNSRTFTTAFNLALATDSPSASIRYTLDGSMPTASSALYGSGILITTTTQVRARSFEAGLVDGPVSSASFILLDSAAAAFSSEIPVIVIETFGQGEIPHPDDADRQAGQIMIFEPVDGVTRLTDGPVVSSRAGLRRRGESTLRPTGSKPNLSVETWGEIDEESRSIEPLGLPAESDWVLYAPWTIDTAMIRNPFIYAVSNEAGRYAVRTRFVEVFLNQGGGGINGSKDYYGLYILMEKIKQGPDRVDIADLPASVTSEPDISGGYIWKMDKADPDDQNLSAAGKTLTGVYPSDMPAAQLSWLTEAINDADDLIPNGNYESLIDVPSFADHHILNVFANNADGLVFSTYYHKNRKGLIEMGPIWDFDRSMGCDVDERASDPEVWSLATDKLFFFHSRGPLWFRSLALNDPDFWMVWVDRWQAMRRGPLSDSAMSERIESFRAEIFNAALRNYQRWSGVLSSSEWSGKVDVMKSHVLTRAGWIDDQFIDSPVMSQTGGVVPSGYQLSLSGTGTKYYTTDTSDPRASGGSPSGSRYSSPITITENTLVKARAGNGQAFVNAPSTWPWSPLTEAMFVVEPASLAITEMMYHPRPAEGPAEEGFTSSDFEFIEIRNTSAVACRLVGVQLLDGVEFDFSYGESSTLAAGEFGVVVSNLEAFKARYPDWAALNVLGEFEGSLSNGSEKVMLGYKVGGLEPLAEIDYADDWYPCTDGEGFSLVLRDSQSASASWDARAAWQHSSGIDGSPGLADPAPAFPPGSLVINEVLTHQDENDPGDWIELHNTTDSSIDIGGWFLSDSRSKLKKYTIPAGIVIPAMGYLVLTEFDHFGAAFALSERGDSVYLSAGSGGSLTEPAYRESVSFGAQERDVSFGRHLRADGSAVFSTQQAVTSAASNAGPRVGPVVIGEIMYHPPEGGHEYLEIRNVSEDTVRLYDIAYPSNTWKVEGIGFEFPAGVQLGAYGSLLLVRNTIPASLFRQIYQVPGSIAIFNYEGALDNDADSLILTKPGTPDVGTGRVPEIVVEQVNYRDGFPWTAEADGHGKALGRVDESAYADDPANWQGVDASYAPTSFPLAVVDGSGGGSYTEGSVVTLQADPPDANQVFVRWTGNVSGVAELGNPVTQLTMPGQGVTVTALYSNQIEFIAADAEWRYHDGGQDLGSAWRAIGYDDSSPPWSDGIAQLGYGDGDETSTVGFGGDEDNKHITTYFRKSFTVSKASSLGQMTLELLRDDGAVVHVNGQTLLSDNMPAGAIGHLTLASSTVGGDSEDAYHSFELDPSVFVEGTNVLAIEIHQRAADSSDLSFAARLIGTQLAAAASLDGDADGMADEWEVSHFGSTEAGVPGVDADGDGFTNQDEFIAGTLPSDGSSSFGITQIMEEELSSGITLFWIPVPGRIYSVQWTDDLRSPFATIATGLVGGSYTDTAHLDDSSGFYRISVGLDPSDRP